MARWHRGCQVKFRANASLAAVAVDVRAQATRLHAKWQGWYEHSQTRMLTWEERNRMDALSAHAADLDAIATVLERLTGGAK